jgi:membrane protease YdiL (CAAX protease family)
VRDTGVGLGEKRVGFTAAAVLFAVFLPVVYLASRHPEFSNHYPLCSAAKESWRAFIVYELAYASYFVAWEYLFRGYLLFSLEPAMGKLAIFAQMMPFALAHLGKPELEALGSIIAGVVLGALALRTRSFWYGAMLHIAIAFSMDLLTAWRSLGDGG